MRLNPFYASRLRPDAHLYSCAKLGADGRCTVYEDRSFSFITKQPRMKLGTVTYNLAQDWDIPTIIKNCEAAGFQGVELRTSHKHGVEVSLSPDERGEVKQRVVRGAMGVGHKPEAPARGSAPPSLAPRACVPEHDQANRKAHYPVLWNTRMNRYSPAMKGLPPLAQRMIDPSTLSAIASARFSAFNGDAMYSTPSTCSAQS